jgi:lysophospholipase L1-like esterase
MRRTVIVLIAALALVATACSDSDDSSSGSGPAAAEEDVAAGDKLSIVVIGDSVAAGEGIAYGFTYDYDASSPKDSHWTGGTDSPTWAGDYPLCHDDDKAYGNVVAAALSADLAKFACTGATYLNGITADQTTGSGPIKEVMRPAQFGDWSTKQNLNADYDTAAPDVVILTFGADDVSFHDIVQYCVLGFNADDAADDQSIADSDDPSAAIHAASQKRAPELKAAREAGDTSLLDDSESSVCTAANPGKTIEKLFWEPINSGEIAQHYQDMVTAIKARGQDPAYGNGKVPKIIFTTYHHPLPKGLDGDCWDVWPLSSAEQQYLQSLQETLQTTLEDAVSDLDDVTISDISGSMDGHRWCSEDPWTYGMSIVNYELKVDSPAPFHPTPDGQGSIAKIVEASVNAVTAGG